MGRKKPEGEEVVVYISLYFFFRKMDLDKSLRRLDSGCGV